MPFQPVQGPGRREDPGAMLMRAAGVEPSRRTPVSFRQRVSSSPPRDP